MKCPYIIGKKIYLRPLEAEDLKRGYHDWINDPEVNKYIMAGNLPTSFCKLNEYYENIMKSDKDIMFAIVVKKTNKYIGNIKLGRIDWINRSALSGRLIGDKKSWGKGYGTEALQLLIDYAFNTLNLNRVYTITMRDNIASIRSNEKMGMRKEGTWQQYRFMEGEYKDAVQLAITRDRYNRLKNKKRR